jgi:hypothetical protein
MVNYKPSLVRYAREKVTGLTVHRSDNVNSDGHQKDEAARP